MKINICCGRVLRGGYPPCLSEKEQFRVECDMIGNNVLFFCSGILSDSVMNSSEIHGPARPTGIFLVSHLGCAPPWLD
jgi:hypothetical protein